MNAHNCHCTDEHRGAPSHALTGKHRLAWRNALAALASPMVRLHHLRNVRTQMLRDALASHDCHNTGCGDA